MNAHEASGGVRKAQRALRLPEVLERTGLSRATIRRLEVQGRFPKARRPSPRVVYWVEAEVDAWIRRPDRTDGARR